MLAAVQLLDIAELEVAQGALRQGALHDLLDHEPPADKEAAEILALQQDFGVDSAQADQCLPRGPDAAAQHSPQRIRQ